MQKEITLKLKPEEAASDDIISKYITQSAGIKADQLQGFLIEKKSIDARSKQIWINLSLKAFINEPFIQRSNLHYRFQSLPNNAKKVMIIGAGPAGLFAALELILLGIKPIIIERGLS